MRQRSGSGADPPQNARCRPHHKGGTRELNEITNSRSIKPAKTDGRKAAANAAAKRAAFALFAPRRRP